MISEGSYSIKSSLLNDEMLAQRRQKEKYAIAVGLLAQFVWAVSNVQIKTYAQLFPGAFSNNSLTFYRSFPICVLGYIFAKKKGIEITPIKNIKHKFWFWVRSFGNYFIVILWIMMMKYFRVSTCQCICGCHPVIVIYLSLFILKETFYIRYLAGVFFCIAGTSIIVLNEKRAKATQVDTENKNILVGIIISLIHLMLLSLATFGQKILCKQHLTAEEQNYYLGMYNSLPAFVMMILENHYGLTNIIYVIYAMSNGFVFYVGNYYTTLALENISISKFVPLTYMCTVFIYILGFILLHEKVFFTDVVGSLMILSFQLYNVWVPIKKK